MTQLSFQYRTKTTIKKHYALYYEFYPISSKPNFNLVIKSRSFMYFTANSFSFVVVQYWVVQITELWPRQSPPGK